MKHILLTTASFALVFSAAPAFAQHRHHVYTHRSVAVDPPAEYAPGQIIFDATERAQHEPGFTSELAPDAKQTATGGPVGGVPGLEGGN